MLRKQRIAFISAKTIVCFFFPLFFFFYKRFNLFTLPLAFVFDFKCPQQHQTAPNIDAADNMVTCAVQTRQSSKILTSSRFATNSDRASTQATGWDPQASTMMWMMRHQQHQQTRRRVDRTALPKLLSNKLPTSVSRNTRFVFRIFQRPPALRHFAHHHCNIVQFAAHRSKAETTSLSKISRLHSARNGSH